MPEFKALLRVCDEKHATLLMIVRAASGGMPVQTKILQQRFGLSRATAKRYGPLVRAALELPASDPRCRERPLRRPRRFGAGPSIGHP